MSQKPAAKLNFDGESLKLNLVAIALLKEDPKNPRDHSDEHVAEIADSIGTFGMNVPILIDENNVIVAGTATRRACLKLGLTKAPVVVVSHMSEAQKVGLRIAHNRMSEKGIWDPILLAENFEFLAGADFEFDLDVTGFEFGEIDVMLLGGKEAIKAAEKAAAEQPENVEMPDIEEEPVSRLGDRFTIGKHVVVCGDATTPDAYRLVLGSCKADLALTDGPYNVATATISGRGRTKHSDFIQGSGEMGPEEFQEFIGKAARQMNIFCRPGAYILMFTGWYSLFHMITGANRIFGRLAHICIWAKTNGGMGSPWRNTWEGILVYRNKGGRVQNNILLGKYGRNRSTVRRA